VTWAAPLLDAPPAARDKFVEPYFRHAKPDQVVVILKAREPARRLIAIGKKAENRWPLQFAQRWVDQYNFYVNDAAWGRMFVRVCPDVPVSARVCLNQHQWLANQMRAAGIAFRQCTNAFLSCRQPTRLQELADSLTPRDLEACGQKWLTAFTPFFTANERRRGGAPRLFFAQVESADTALFHRRAALDHLGERLFDANRTIGQPTTLTRIFGRKVTKRYRGHLQTVIEDLDLPNPVIRTHDGQGFAKQYVRDHVALRTEPATNHVNDYGGKKAVEHLPELRDKRGAVIDNDLNVQQDILETFVDRGQLRTLAAPTVLPSGRRIPGLKLDHPRHLALMHALGWFAHIPAQQTFTTAERYPKTLAALGVSATDDTLAALRDDLSKLRAKALVTTLPHSRRYQRQPHGYTISVVFLKLFERIYAPLTAGLLQPFRGDTTLPDTKRSQLDRLYQRVVNDLNTLLDAVGLKAAA